MRITDLLSEKDYFYIMHLSWGNNYRRKELWDFARRKRIIGLDHRNVCGDWPTVKDKVKNLSGLWVNQFDMLCEDIGPKSISNGDIVVLMAGWEYILGIGMVIGPHRYDITYRNREEFFDHVRPVQWILEFDYEKRKKIPRVVFDKTLSRIEKDDERWQLFSNLDFREETQHPTPSKTKQNDAEKLKELARIQTELTKETTRGKRFKRSRELVEGLKQLYDYQCQLCSSKSTNIPQIPMRNGNNYVEVHHIKGFNEVSHIEGTDQEEADYVIDNYKNVITVCVYHHKLLHKHKDEFSYVVNQRCFISKDKSSKILLVLNKHL